MTRKRLSLTVLISAAVIVIAVVAILVAPKARAKGNPAANMHGSQACRGSETRICFFSEANYLGAHDSFRCNQAGKQTFDHIKGNASSAINNCGKGSAFTLVGKADDGKPAPTLIINGQQQLPELAKQNFDNNNDYVMRRQDGAPAPNAGGQPADFANDGHTCRGTDTRICFFDGYNFTGAEESFRCDIKHGDLKVLYGKASSVINNCGEGSHFRMEAVSDGKDHLRLYGIGGQTEIGNLKYHRFDNAAASLAPGPLIS